VALTGLIFALATVHVWGPTSVFFMFYIGAGVWIAQAGAKAVSEDEPDSGPRRGTARMRSAPSARAAVAASEGETPAPALAPTSAAPGRVRPKRHLPPTRIR
jgi:hypothetical protein